MSKNKTIKEIQLVHDLTSGELNYTTNFSDVFNNFSLKMIKIKSTNNLIDTVTVSTVEKNTSFNTILYTKSFTTGTDLVVTADDNFLFKEGTQCKLNITNIGTVGNVYVTLYFDII